METSAYRSHLVNHFNATLQIRLEGVPKLSYLGVSSRLVPWGITLVDEYGRWYGDLEPAE
jgi:hypothetical protein